MSSPDLLTRIHKQGALLKSPSQPVYLTSVEVNGGDTFTRQFFAKLLTPLVDQSDYTLAQLLARVEQSHANLQKTNVFRTIDASLHVDYLHPPPKGKLYNKDKLILTRVVFDLDAMDMSTAEASLGFNTEDNLVVNLGYLNNNFNHNAELVNIGVNYRPYKPSEHLVSTMRLVSNLTNPTFKFVLDLYNSHDNNQAWQQNSSKATGGVIGVLYLNLAKTVSMFNGLALTKRTIYDIDDGAHDSLKIFAGDYLKLSIVSRLAYSNVAFLGESFPATGISATVLNEICSDQEQEATNTLTFFVKSAVAVNLYKTCRALTAHVFHEAGAIYASASNSTGVHLADRFYLGGFNSFKGFARNSVNDQGGMQYYKAGVAVFSKVPSFAQKREEVNPLRLYATGFVGNVGDNVLAERGAFSAGVGLRYFNKWASLDAGYYVSKRLGSDSVFGVRDGFQLEVSLGGTNRTA